MSQEVGTDHFTPAALVGFKARQPAGADPVAADGSAERPYADIEDSIVRAGSGAWVLLARGVYHERPLATGTAVHVVGVCAARTIIEGITPSEGAAPTFNARSAGTDVTLRNVTLRGTGYGLQAHSGATLRVSGAVIEDSGGAGVFGERPGVRRAVGERVLDAEAFGDIGEHREHAIEPGDDQRARAPTDPAPVTAAVDDAEHDVAHWQPGP